MKIILTLSLISILISACGDNDNLVTPEPVNPQNSPPVINTIFVPEQVHAGARITLGALTEDPDGDTLTYNWQVAGGVLRSNSTPKVIWTTPTEIGFTTVTLSVKDPANKVVTKSAEVSVIHSLIVPGQEAAGIRLGTLLSDAVKLYGTPKHLPLDPHPDVHDEPPIHYHEWKHIGIIVYVDSSDRIYRIEIREPNTAKTVGCNGIGSPYDKVRDEFGPPLYEGGGSAPDGRGREIDEYWGTGISFTYSVNPDADHKSITHLDPDDIGSVTQINIYDLEYDP